MTEIRSVADASSGEIYYPQTHYQAVIDFNKGVRNLISSSYLIDLKSISDSGLFYFDKNTKNKPDEIDSGFIQAVFIDRTNGFVKLLGTLNFYEIKDGTWSGLQTEASIIKEVPDDTTK